MEEKQITKQEAAWFITRSLGVFAAWTALNRSLLCIYLFSLLNTFEDEIENSYEWNLILPQALSILFWLPIAYYLLWKGHWIQSKILKAFSTSNKPIT